MPRARLCNGLSSLLGVAAVVPLRSGYLVAGGHCRFLLRSGYLVADGTGSLLRSGYLVAGGFCHLLLCTDYLVTCGPTGGCFATVA